MKGILTKKRIILFSGVSSLIGFLLFVFFDAYRGVNFRSASDRVWTMQEVDLTGLKDLRASGGAAIRFPDLKRRLSHIKGPKYIVDGMSEYHGYVKGIPMYFFGYHRDKILFKHIVRRLAYMGTTEKKPDLLVSEAEEAQNYGFKYKRVMIGRGCATPDQDIDEFIDFCESVPSDAWLHFHCSHGKGRTSTMLIMLDILKNAPQVSVQDIVKRQHLLGSEDLFNTEVWKRSTYSKDKLEARKKFIEDFYEFVRQRKSGGTQRWSDWRKELGLENKGGKIL